MDEAERRVLRRKRHAIAGNVEMNKEFVNGLQNAGLIDAVMYREIMVR